MRLIDSHAFFIGRNKFTERSRLIEPGGGGDRHRSVPTTGSHELRSCHWMTYALDHAAGSPTYGGCPPVLGTPLTRRAAVATRSRKA